MSHVVCDVKFLESPFPHGFHAAQMVKFHHQNLDNFYQVIQVLGQYFLAKRLKPSCKTVIVRIKVEVLAKLNRLEIVLLVYR